MKKVGIFFRVLFFTGVTICLAGSSALAEEPHEEDKVIDKIVTGYLKMRAQLAVDSLSGVSIEARNIIRHASAVVKKDDRAPNQKMDRRFKTIAAMGYYASHIPHREIGEVRENFAKMSQMLIKYVETPAYANKNRDKLFFFYCPTQTKYWIQETKDLANPYFGKEMSTCGNQVEGLQKKNP